MTYQEIIDEIARLPYERDFTCPRCMAKARASVLAIDAACAFCGQAVKLRGYASDGSEIEDLVAAVSRWLDRAPRDHRRSRDKLLALLVDRSFAKKRVVLASGKESDFFIDCKQTVLTAEGHVLVGELLLDAMAPFSPAAVAGVELGGCPLASAVSLTSYLRGKPLDALYVRKDAKDHGSRREIEGDTKLPLGSRVALVEDVITTGGSTLKAAEKLRGAGHVVVGVAALVDRQEGGRENIEKSGLPVVALFTRGDFPG